MEVLRLIKLGSAVGFFLSACLAALLWGLFRNERLGIKFTILAWVFVVSFASINDW